MGAIRWVFVLIIVSPIAEKKIMTSSEIFINPEKCLKDGICINVCPCQIFKKSPSGVPEVNTDLIKTCIKCGHCASVCPGNAITVKALNPDDYRSESKDLPTFDVFANLVMSRRSVRNFKDKPVEIATIQKIVDMTRFCPTAKNTQSLSWLIVDGREKVRKLSAAVIDTFRTIERMAPLVEAFDKGDDVVSRGAPQLAIVYGPEKYPWGVMDAAIAVANFELAAKASGIGSCWGGFITSAAATDKKIGKSIGLDDSDKIFAAVMVGYPKYSFKKIPPRSPLRMRVF